MIKHRNSIFTRLKSNPDDHLKDAYRKFRNTINRDIKIAKKLYYTKYFEDCKNNMKKTWKGINDLIRNRSTLNNINQLSINNLNIYDPLKIANSMNDFFTNVGPNTEKSIPQTPISPISFLGTRIEPNFSISPTSVQEVMILLLQLDNSYNSS